MVEENKYNDFYAAYNEMVQKKELEQSCLSDLTYDAFQEFVFECIPELITDAIENNKKNFFVNFKFQEKIKNKVVYISYGELGTMHLYIGNKDEFMKYVFNIPGTKIGDDYYTVTFDLKQLIDYYYEELQREEYLTQQGKSR